MPPKLGKAKHTKSFRNFGINTKGYLGPNSSTNINNVEIYLAGRCWIPLRSIPSTSPRKETLPHKTKAPATLHLARAPLRSLRSLTHDHSSPRISIHLWGRAPREYASTEVVDSSWYPPPTAVDETSTFTCCV